MLFMHEKNVNHYKTCYLSQRNDLCARFLQNHFWKIMFIALPTEHSYMFVEVNFFERIVFSFNFLRLLKKNKCLRWVMIGWPLCQLEKQPFPPRGRWHLHNWLKEKQAVIRVKSRVKSVWKNKSDQGLGFLKQRWMLSFRHEETSDHYKTCSYN